MKQIAKYLIKATIVLISIGLLAGGITYAIIGINFCIDGVYGARQALGHFFICGLYIFLACIVFASKNSDCAGEFFNDK